MAGETCTTSMCWTFGQLCITSVKAYYRATRPKSQLVNTRRHETADHPVKVGEFGSRLTDPDEDDPLPDGDALAETLLCHIGHRLHLIQTRGNQIDYRSRIQEPNARFPMTEDTDVSSSDSGANQKLNVEAWPRLLRDMHSS